MTPDAFVAKWQGVDLKERSAAQEHFIDLCRMLGEPTPVEADPTGETYCFERGATKDSGGDGFADVWKRRHFGWEYKGPHANLDAAFRQLRQYSLALDNPPLLIVSDMQRFRIHTSWTNSVSETHEFGLETCGTRPPETSSSGRSRTPSGCVPARRGRTSPSARRSGSPRWPSRCGIAAKSRRPWRTSSTVWSSACSPRTWACCPTICSPACWSRRDAVQPSSPIWPASCSARWPIRAAAWVSRPWRGSTADSSTTTPP